MVEGCLKGATADGAPLCPHQISRVPSARAAGGSQDRERCGPIRLLADRSTRHTVSRFGRPTISARRHSDSIRSADDSSRTQCDPIRSAGVGRDTGASTRVSWLRACRCSECLVRRLDRLASRWSPGLKCQSSAARIAPQCPGRIVGRFRRPKPDARQWFGRRFLPGVDSVGRNRRPTRALRPDSVGQARRYPDTP